MKYYFWVLTLIAITNSELYSQTNIDSTLFSQTAELQLFTNYNDANAFELLYLIDNEAATDTTKHKKAFYAFLANLDKKLPRRNSKRTARIIYEQIHENYFTKYVDNPIFSDIFKNSNYNCVTATALYALALEYLKIPYEIRELPSHVYLIAFPKTEKIVFETTTPGSGLMRVNKKYVDYQKKYLVSNKVVTEQEANSEHFFDKHILTDSIISLKQLIGVQYYNTGIKYIEEEELEKAKQQMEKAYFYHKETYIKDYLNYMFFASVEKSLNGTPANICSDLTKLYRYNKDAETVDFNIVFLYEGILKEQIDKEQGDEIIISQYDCIKNEIETDSIVDKMKDITHLVLARHYYNSMDFDRSLSMMEEIYDESKTNVHLYIKNCLKNKLYKITSPEEGLDSLSYYEEKFSFVAKDEEMLGFKVWCLLKLVYVHFELDEIDEGMVYLNQFRAEFKPEDKVKYPEDMVGLGFGAASSHYFRKEQLGIAKNLLSEGLAYAPYSLQLKRKMKLLKEFVGGK